MLQPKATNYDNQVVTMHVDMSNQIIEIIGRYLSKADDVIRLEKPQRLVVEKDGIGMVDMTITGDSSIVEISKSKIICCSLAKKEVVEEFNKITSSILQVPNKLIV